MKYKAKISVDYEFEVEDLIGVTDEDIENYKDVFNENFFDNSEEIKNKGHLILAELENAIYRDLPTSTPYTNKAFKIKPNMEVVSVSVETL